MGDIPCQGCKKNTATVHLTDISPQGEKCERHLCESCAQSEGVVPKPQISVNLGQLLSAFIEGGKLSAKQIAALTCPKCKLNFVEFRNSGLLGCPNDYDALEKALLPLIERAHKGETRHIGKVPRRLRPAREVENDLIRLRRELNRAVDDERYELAAEIRDRIRTLETQ